MVGASRSAPTAAGNRGNTAITKKTRTNNMEEHLEDAVHHYLVFPSIAVTAPASAYRSHLRLSAVRKRRRNRVFCPVMPDLPLLGRLRKRPGTPFLGIRRGQGSLRELCPARFPRAPCRFPRRR